jgi:hypothetical protein
MDLSTLHQIKTEMKRFEVRLNKAIERLKADSIATNGEVRRAAMDLKNELTKITR